MSEPAGELWILTVRLPRGLPNPARFMARLLKWLLRVWGVKCVAIQESAEVRRLQVRVAAVEAEAEHLRRLVASLVDRCARQHEVIAVRAERRNAS